MKRNFVINHTEYYRKSNISRENDITLPHASSLTYKSPEIQNLKRRSSAGRRSNNRISSLTYSILITSAFIVAQFFEAAETASLYSEKIRATVVDTDDEYQV